MNCDVILVTRRACARHPPEIGPLETFRVRGLLFTLQCFKASVIVRERDETLTAESRSRATYRYTRIENAPQITRIRETTSGATVVVFLVQFCSDQWWCYQVYSYTPWRDLSQRLASVAIGRTSLLDNGDNKLVETDIVLHCEAVMAGQGGGLKPPCVIGPLKIYIL